MTSPAASPSDGEVRALNEKVFHEVLALISAAIGAALIAAMIYVSYGYADRLAAIVGPSGMNVILRLSSFLLVCIGVQIFWNGLSGLIKTLKI